MGRVVSNVALGTLVIECVVSERVGGWVLVSNIAPGRWVIQLVVGDTAPGRWVGRWLVGSE